MFLQTGLRVLVAALALCASSLAAQTLYAAVGESGAPGVLYTVNPATAAATAVGNITVGATQVPVCGLAFHPTTGELYGVTPQMGATAFQRRLLLINPATGAATDIGSLGASPIPDIAFNAAGTLFGYRVGPNDLVTINLATAACTTVGATGAATTQGAGMAISPAGQCFISLGSTSGTLDSLNLSTGARTVGPTLSGSPVGAPQDFINALAFSSASNLFGIARNGVGSYRLVRIDATGAITDIGALPTDLNALAFATPTVSNVSPGSGPLAGGQSAIITGTSFDGATGVTFGGAAATGVTVVNSTTITCTTPAHAAGQVSVVVTTPKGTNPANTLYTYQGAPTVTNVNPATGSTAGGTNVTITGTNFNGATAVTFGGTAATAVNVVSPTSITATTPAHAAGAVSVDVTTPSGTNAANTLFTYVAPAPVMAVARGATPIADAGTDAQGNISATVAQNLTYTISNSGTSTLNLTGTPNLVVLAAVSNVTSLNITVQPSTTVGVSLSTNFTLTYTVVGPGAFSFTISIANNDPGTNKNPYNWTVSGTGVAAPEMDLTRGAAIADGGADTVTGATEGTVVPLNYTIANSGNLVLNVTLPVNIGALNNCTATVTAAPSATVAAAGNTPFTITVTPTAAGAFSFTVSITNDDANENPYDWTVSGVAASSGGGGGGGDEGGGCATESGSGPMFLAALASLLLALASRRAGRSRSG